MSDFRTIEQEKKGIERIDTEQFRYPCFNIALKHLPEAKNWKINETYDIGLRIKLKRIVIERDDDFEKKGDVDFDIVGISVGDQKTPFSEKPELSDKEKEAEIKELDKHYVVC